MISRAHSVSSGEIDDIGVCRAEGIDRFEESNNT